MITPYAKAIVGFLAPGAVILTGAVVESSPSGVSITLGELVTAVCAMVITAGGVYVVPNRGTGRHEARP